MEFFVILGVTTKAFTVILFCDESSKYQAKIINFIDQENRLSDLRVGSQQIVGLEINRLQKEINPYKEPFEAL